MKRYWEKFALRVDALSLRERVIVFAAAVLVLAVLINTFLLNPQYARQTALSQQIKQDQSRIADLQNRIQQTVKARETDPDRADRERLQALQQQIDRMSGALTDVQKHLVPPGQMADLLQDVLKRQGRLALVSLKTLPVTALNGMAQPAGKPDQPKADAAASAPPAADDGGVKTVYRHAVELTVQGSYLDMLAYMRLLEAMPWQLFWGSAQLTVGAYPKATLTLTLFTLSLDKTWLDL